MPEFLNEADIRLIANTEVDQFLSDIPNLESLAGYYSRPGEHISNSEIDAIVDYMMSAIGSAGEVIRKAERSLYNTDDFVLYARRKIREAIRPIEDDLAQPPGTDHEIPVSSLRFPSFVDEYLRLLQVIARSQKTAGGPGADLSGVQSRYLRLVNHPASKLIPDIEAQISALPDHVPALFNVISSDEAHPEMRFTRTDVERFSSLTPEEVDGLELLYTDSGQRVPAWLNNNPNALNNILSRAANYDADPPAPIPSRSEIESLRQKLLDFQQDLIINPSLAATHNITSARAQEIIDVITYILDIQLDENFQAWLDVLRNKMVYGTYDRGEYYEDFLIRIETKLRARVPLTDEEKADLNELMVYLREQRNNVGDIWYAEDDAGYNNRIREATTSFIDDEIERVQDLHNRGGVVVAVEAGPPSPESETINNVRRLYREYQKYNAYLPEFDDIHPDESQSFFQELHTAMMALYNEKVDEYTASGDGGGLPFAGDKLDIWSGDLVNMDVDFKASFQYFFHNFPYEKVSADLVPGTPEYQRYSQMIENLYKFRLLAIVNSQRLAFDYRENAEDLQNKENMLVYIKMVKKRINEGGYGGWDQGPMHTRFFEDPVMIEIFGREDRTWMLGEHMNYFQAYIHRAAKDPNLNPFPILFNGHKLVEIKAKAIANIPDSARYDRDEDMLEVAWTMALWTIQHTFKIFGYGPDGLEAKAERVFCIRDSLQHSGGYGVKILAGEAETGDRIVPTIATQVERAAFDRDSFIHVLVNLPPGSYDLMSWADYKTQYPKEARHLAIRAIYDGVDENGNHVREEAEEAVKKRYAIVRLKPEWCTYGELGKDGQPLGEPIVIPHAYFDHSEHQGVPHMIPMSLFQVRASSLDTSHIDWSSITVNHQRFYVDSMENLGQMYTDFHDPRGPWGFTDVTSSAFDHKILATIAPTQLGEQMEHWGPKILQSLEAFGVSGQDMVLKYTHQLEHMVQIERVSMDELATKPADSDKGGGAPGMKFTTVIQYIGKYCVGKLKECGPKYSGEEQGELNKMPMVEQWTEVYRKLTRLSIEEIKEQIENDPRAAKNKRKELRNRLQTGILPGVRLAVDAAYDGYRSGDPDYLAKKIGQAERTIIVCAFMVALGAYLDRYRYVKVDDGEEEVVTFDVEKDYNRMKTASGAKPLDAGRRKLLRAYVGKILEHFASPDFADPKFPPLVTYDLHYFDQMCEDRGLNSSTEAFIVYRHWLKVEYPKIHAKNKDSKH